MTALEIRQDEIGAFSIEAYRARRARMFNVKSVPKPPPLPQPELVVRALPSFPPTRPVAVKENRARHYLDCACYIVSIGPVCRRDILVVSSQPFLKNISTKKIIAVVAETYGLNINDILSNRRTRTLVRPRQEAMWLCKLHTRHSLPEIGRRFGGRDHTTVLHACRKIEELIRDHDYRPLAAPHVERLARQYEEFSSPKAAE